MSLKGYDAWKTTPQEEREECDDPDCTCNGDHMRPSVRRNCPVHGPDPDALRDAWIDEQTFR